MASKIKETPILKGKDAERFIATMKDNKSNKIDADTLKRMQENFAKLKSISTFS